MDATTLAPAPPPLPPLDNTLGAVLLGTFAGLILEGLLIHQSIRYFRLYPNDTLLLKLWVSAVMFIETLNSALNIHQCFYTMVVNYYNPLALEEPPVWSVWFSVSSHRYANGVLLGERSVFLITGVGSAALTECFFMRRVWLVGRQYRVLVIIAMVFEMMFMGCYLSLLSRWNAPNLQEFLGETWLLTLGSGLFGCGDLMIASVLIYVLRKSRTGIKRTNWTLDVLVRYTFTTGFIITFFQVISIICSSLWPRTCIFWPIDVILTKTAASSMLISLIMRNWLGSTEVTDMDPMSPFTTSIKFQGSQGPMNLSTFRSKFTQNASKSGCTAESEDIELGVGGEAGKGSSSREVLHITAKGNGDGFVRHVGDNV
ncbi:hypothetical protein L227DRAFT_658565 [Lentinus tigrinus ALCF2SS1-6]|uniref:DUF6534 domain-containing protein n=1 Tax=Lentinus tigrinus ALCF2SS1-6 TaxID=1328759 RepID=A0A5C2RP93_9APHY|nr:hypothetical protein L227DRAFT_658565 [Lentinus tigrinus ALCF2SS1-6]